MSPRPCPPTHAPPTLPHPRHSQDIHPPLAKLVFAIVLMLRGFVGAEEERVVWWGKDGFVGTKDWLLL